MLMLPTTVPTFRVLGGRVWKEKKKKKGIKGPVSFLEECKSTHVKILVTYLMENSEFVGRKCLVKHIYIPIQVSSSTENFGYV